VVVKAMMPYLNQHFGNPASDHAFGQTAAVAVSEARSQLGNLLGAPTDDLIFTSCASESINIAIKGVAMARRRQGNHLITSAVEHPASIQACRYLQQEFGFDLSIIPVGSDGRVDAEAVRAAIRPETVLISIMHAQNETGTLQPIREIGRIARANGIPFHVDAAQTVGKIEVDVEYLSCDLLTIAGHKLYAPKGIGALYIRNGLTLHSLIHGASYEGGRRAGTANVPYIVALGKAAELAGQALAAGEAERQSGLRDRLHVALAERLSVQLNGHEVERLPNTLNISIRGVVGNDLLKATPEIAASTGSACHAGVNKPNETLLAMGADAERALGVLRLSVGRYTTVDQIDFAAERLSSAARR